jgi:hypothetical protein
MHRVIESVLEVRAEIHLSPRYGVILQPWQTHIRAPTAVKYHRVYFSDILKARYY